MHSAKKRYAWSAKHHAPAEVANSDKEWQAHVQVNIRMHAKTLHCQFGALRSTQKAQLNAVADSYSATICKACGRESTHHNAITV